MVPRILATVAFALVAAACSKPAVVVVDEPPPPPPVKVEAPAAPKCESLLEACHAKADTRARIARSNLVFTPVPGWVYVQGDTATRAQGDEEGAALVITAYAADADPKKELAQRDQAFADAAKEVGLSVPKAKVAWKVPTCKCTKGGCTGTVQDLCKPLKPVPGMSSNLWQLDGGARGSKKGPLLVVQAPLPDGKALLIIGFVPDDDKTKADELILQAVDTVGPAAGGDTK